MILFDLKMPFTSKQKQRQYQREYQRQRRRKKSNTNEASEHKIASGTKLAIIITIFLAVAILSLLSWFGLAGPMGQYIKAAFVLAFGWGAIMFPLLLIALAILLWRGIGYQVNRIQVAGFIVVFLSVLGILHHAPDFSDPAAAVADSMGGGYIGFGLARPIMLLAGYWGGWVILMVCLTVGVLLSLGTVLFRSAGEDENEDASDIDEEPIITEHQTFLSQLWGKFNTWRYARAYATPPDEEVESEVAVDEVLLPIDSMAAEEQEPIPVPKIRREIKVPLDLLEAGKEKPSADDIDVTKEKIAKTLADFGILVEMGEVFIGPSITQYTLKPAEGVKLSRITSLNPDLSLALAAHPIRIEAPIPGKSLVGIEVPNTATATVKLKDILQSTAFRNRPSNLSLALGKDVAGKSWVVDLAKMPHLLIAGSTGSGKSVAINSLVVSLIYQNSPDDLKFVLVDPKKVELVNYNDIPYLLTPVITDVKKTINALKWTIGEMERRYILLSQRGKRNIASYNEANKKDSLPYIVFVIDELADLMAVASAEVEGAIVRLAQMARAVGIHLVLATQRPSVNVLTGLIKANVPSRIAFSVPSQIDSRTILDMAGAEKLLGRGDMLFISPDLGKPRRLQGTFLDDKEIERVVNFLKEQGGADYQSEVIEHLATGSSARHQSDGADDDLYDDAKQTVLRAGKASASLLQRRLRIGYARAARLLDILEAEGVIGPADGAKPRDILLTEISTPINENESVAESPAAADEEEQQYG
ncbi:MAG: DNA translocase FtsK 4TM domain-containing protein [Candidatus Komeilibacteria bacterium]|nr:DNA translocase FtsK 4TM domain-containing protein [Candidatus Komeilibacteria bacterium]